MRWCLHVSQGSQHRLPARNSCFKNSKNIKSNEVRLGQGYSSLGEFEGTAYGCGIQGKKLVCTAAGGQASGLTSSPDLKCLMPCQRSKQTWVKKS